MSQLLTLSLCLVVVIQLTSSHYTCDASPQQATCGNPAAEHLVSALVKEVLHSQTMCFQKQYNITGGNVTGLSNAIAQVKSSIDQQDVEMSRQKYTLSQVLSYARTISTNVNALIRRPSCAACTATKGKSTNVCQ